VISWPVGGGEEFILLLNETSLEEAITMAERFLQRIAAREFELEQGIHKITLSIVAERDASLHRRVDDLINQADGFLYTAKAQGHNRVCSPGTEAEGVA